MRAQFHNVTGTVIFFVLTGFFVFFDNAVFVIFCACSTDDTGLNVIIHLQLIDVEMFAFIEGEGSFLAEFLKGGTCLIVNFFAVEINSGSKVDFRA